MSDSSQAWIFVKGVPNKDLKGVRRIIRDYEDGFESLPEFSIDDGSGVHYDVKDMQFSLNFGEFYRLDFNEMIAAFNELLDAMRDEDNLDLRKFSVEMWFFAPDDHDGIWYSFGNGAEYANFERAIEETKRAFPEATTELVRMLSEQNPALYKEMKKIARWFSDSE